MNRKRLAALALAALGITLAGALLAFPQAGPEVVTPGDALPLTRAAVDWGLIGIKFGLWMLVGSWFRLWRWFQWSAAKARAGEAITLTSYWRAKNWEVCLDVMSHVGLGAAWAFGLLEEVLLGLAGWQVSPGITMAKHLTGTTMAAFGTAAAATEIIDGLLRQASDKFRRGGNEAVAPLREEKETP